MTSVERPAESGIVAAVDRHGAAVYGVARRITGQTDDAIAISGRIFSRVDPDAASAPDAAAQLVHEAQRLAVARARATALAPATIDQLAPVLDALPPEEAWLLHATYFRGLTYREIAAELDIPPLQAAERLRRALHHLRAATR